MYSLFKSPLSSPALIILTILFFLTSSITVFDKRYIQAKRAGTLPPGEPELASWIALVWWVHSAVLLAIILLNWKYGIGLFILKFILSVLPVLEIIGNMLMRPFRR